MTNDLLQQIVDLLASIDTKLDSLVHTNERINDAVSEMRMDICGFDYQGQRVDGHLSRMLTQLIDIESTVGRVETAVGGVEVAVGGVETAVSLLDIGS